MKISIVTLIKKLFISNYNHTLFSLWKTIQQSFNYFCRFLVNLWLSQDVFQMSTIFVYTNFPTEKCTPGILINDLSDHLPVFVLIKTKPLQKWKSKKYIKHDYSKFDSETFVTKVQKTLNPN